MVLDTWTSIGTLLFAGAISNNGAALDNCWGFIDGTVRPVCRHKQHQRAVYNGHKRVPALTFLSLVTPNGLIVFGLWKVEI